MLWATTHILGTGCYGVHEDWLSDGLGSRALRSTPWGQGRFKSQLGESYWSGVTSSR